MHYQSIVELEILQQFTADYDVSNAIVIGWNTIFEKEALPTSTGL